MKEKNTSKEKKVSSKEKNNVVNDKDIVKSKNSIASKLKILAIVLALCAFIASLVMNIILLTDINSDKEKNSKATENIVFFGDSLTARYNLKFYFPKENVVNKGVGAEKTEDLLKRIETDVYEYNPSKVLVQCGINDITNDVDKDDILLNIQTIITGIKVNRGNAKIYMESLYPVNEKIVKNSANEKHRKLNNKEIQEYNKEIKKICLENNVIYVDVFNEMLDKEGNLKDLYTDDGIHLTNLGYLKITSVLNKYIFD